jgi:uncharacterized protein (DUF1499 family)
MNRLQAWFTVNDVTTGSSPAYPHLQPLVLDQPPDEAFALALATAHDLRGWRIVNVSPKERRFEAEASTPVLPFVDDLDIWIEPRRNDSSRVQVRSRSRVGRGDFGANARRIRNYLRRVAQRVSSGE